MTTLYTATPTISVVDNRGQSIRHLQYNRIQIDTPQDELVARSTYSLNGLLITQIDPRLYTAKLDDPNVVENFRYQSSLTGKVLRSDSVDAGIAFALFDVTGNPVWGQSGAEISQRAEYDVQGRPTLCYQTLPGASETITGRFIYGESLEQPAENNLRGQCYQRYDGAGLLTQAAFSLQGVVQQQTQQLLLNAESLPDWQGASSDEWDALLESTQYITQWTGDADGKWLTLTDAKGNQQQVSYNVAGQIASSSIIAQSTPSTTLSSIDYSAAGQVLQEVAGNGVTTNYTYEAQTQRLLTMRMARSFGDELQNLSYSYDPVGNIIGISDSTAATRFYRNRKVTPENTYSYDALYQLISANGRENANAKQQGPALPEPITDSSQLITYSRSYSYDKSGNLFNIQHIGATSYSQQMVVSNTSNHAVSSAMGTNLQPQDIDVENRYFDASGNALWLQSGQSLGWLGNNRLQQVILVSRDGQPDDREVYQYNAEGMRGRKQTIALTSGTTQTQQVVYLPGLELRTTQSNNGNGVTTTEDFTVLVAQATGRAAVRHLYWETGTPDIPNGQLRYSFNNQIGSSNLELDGDANILTVEEYYPFGGTAVWGGSSSEVKYKYIRYSGKELDSTGLYYYGHRYYMPWLGRWLNPDPSGTADGLNLYCFVKNNPVTSYDVGGFIDEKDLSPELLMLMKDTGEKYPDGYEDESPDAKNKVKERNDKIEALKNDRDTNPFSPIISRVAEQMHKTLFEEAGQYKLPEGFGVNITEYSKDSALLHKLALNIGEDSEGKVAELDAELKMIPAYKRLTFRGAMLDNTIYQPDNNPEACNGGNVQNIIKKGDYVTTQTFFSTSAEKKVASEFVMRQRFGMEHSLKSVVFEISGSSGRNITRFTAIKQAEVLMSPGVIFKVVGVKDEQFGPNIMLEEMPDSIWKNSDIKVRDYRFGTKINSKPRLHKTA